MSGGISILFSWHSQLAVVGDIRPRGLLLTVSSAIATFDVLI